jgi:hypothetical protein
MNNQHPNSTEEDSPSERIRREFLTASAGTIAAPLLAACSSNLLVERSDDGMTYRTFGRTGERVSVIGLGGWHIGQPSTSERESIQLIRQAIDRGITFGDNCWDYNEGASQVRMGKALKDGYRKKVFLMDKTDGRTRKAAAEQIDQSSSGSKPTLLTCSSTTRSSGWRTRFGVDIARNLAMTEELATSETHEQLTETEHEREA